ncbi:MAG: FKBP-type peptidyl-prolyl cis-trans isomerase [Acidimicrobiia bacterium]|nr:FKBP-type peptidyl-prolyl cis-trans isomerase [Acidimicrobiia bacterium]
MLRSRLAAGLVVLTLVATACGDDAAPEATTTASTTTTTTPTATTSTTVVPTVGEPVTTASGLQYTITDQGFGDQPKPGDLVEVHYTGTLEDGTEFDSSYDRGQPFSFRLGQGAVIAGWDEGIGYLAVGSSATLVIPSDLAYGDRANGDIPAGSTLIFDVELVGIVPGPPEAPSAIADDQYTTTDSGLRYHDIEVGDGDVAVDGSLAEVHYTGWLTDGTRFDSSLLRDRTFQFVVGAGGVIAGWDEGVAGMAVGGKRQLVIPPELGYGDAGAGGVIPGGATLVFEVELISIG